MALATYRYDAPAGTGSVYVSNYVIPGIYVYVLPNNYLVPGISNYQVRNIYVYSLITIIITTRNCAVELVTPIPSAPSEALPLPRVLKTTAN